MKTYVSHIIQTYVTHNKAEAALVEEVVKMNRRVVMSNELGKFKREFEKLIRDINKRFPRCGDIELVYWKPDHLKGDVEYRTNTFILMLYWGQ